MINVKRYEKMVKGMGKFEQEPSYTAYYWNQSIEGNGEEHELASIYPDEYGTYTAFRVDADEAEAFNLPIGLTVIVWKDSQGFVLSHTIEDGDVSD